MLFWGGISKNYQEKIFEVHKNLNIIKVASEQKKMFRANKILRFICLQGNLKVHPYIFIMNLNSLNNCVNSYISFNIKKTLKEKFTPSYNTL